MSHDVDVELDECDVSLSFTMPGRLVYLFAYEKKRPYETPGRAPCLMLTREEWDRLTAIVHENLE